MDLETEEDNISVCSQVEEVIKCAICWETPSQPKVLPCQHTFCLRCIHPVYLSSVQQKIQPKDRLQCPICRNTHNLPKAGVEALPTDYKVNVLGDIVQKKRHLQSKRFCVICSVSNKYNTGSYFCVSCCSLLCTKCYQCHRGQPLYKDHVQIPIFTKKTNVLLCADHPKEFIHFYCTDCEIPVCKACTHTGHTAHRVVKFVPSEKADLRVAQDIFEHLNGRLAEIPQEQAALRALLADMDLDKTKTDGDIERIRSKITDLRKKEEELSNLAQYYEEFEDVLKDRRTSLDDAGRQLKDVLSTLNDVVFPLSNLEQVTVSHIPLKSVQKAFSKIKLPEKSVDERRKEYDKVRSNPEALDRHLEGLRSATAVSVFSNIDEDEVNSVVKVVWKNDLDAYDVQFTQDGSKNLLCTGQSLRWRLHMLTFDGVETDIPDYLQDYVNCECRVISSPVTSTVSLTHRKFDDGLVLPYSTIKGEGHTTTPGCIVTSRDQVSLCSFTVTRNDTVVFTFMENKDSPKLSSMRCHTLTGDSVWYRSTGADANSHVQRLCTPYYVITDYMDRLIVSDHLGDKISVFDNIGNHLLTFPKEQDHHFSAEDDDEENDPKPSGICVDSKNNIFVAFPSHHVVTKFTPNGDFIKHVVCTDGKPRGISLWTDRYLAVGVHGEGVYLYDLSPEGEEQNEDSESCDDLSEVEDEHEQDTDRNSVNREDSTSGESVRVQL